MLVEQAPFPRLIITKKEAAIVTLSSKSVSNEPKK
jgi:hypothetical protein